MTVTNVVTAGLFRLGDRVTWGGKSSPHINEKTGEIVEVLPPGRISASVGEGDARNHESYVVRVGRRLYWPRVRGLRLAAESAAVAAPETVLVLRTCDANRQARGGFQWPESGPVEAPDWNPEPICGCGLHGMLWGEGDVSLLNWDPSALWLVVEVEKASIVDLGGKVKFPRGTVIYCGDAKKAAAIVGARAPAGTKVIHGTATAGYRGTATAGDWGTATAGNWGTATAGDRGTATAGNRGTATAGDRGTATAGNWGTATAGDRGTATAGDRGTATAGDRGTATAGNWGTATAGDGGTATAGDGGVIAILWYDPTADRHRVAIGYVGEDGIEADTFYVVGSDGKLVKKEATP